jgi:hypothetical protein
MALPIKKFHEKGKKKKETKTSVTSILLGHEAE